MLQAADLVIRLNTADDVVIARVDLPESTEIIKEGVRTSARGNLRFKGPERLANDFAAALDLRPSDVCNELGQYPCATFVHNVALGGVDPYGPGLYEPSGITAVTTPLAVERMALAACTRRVDADLTTGEPAIRAKGHGALLQ